MFKRISKYWLVLTLLMGATTLAPLIDASPMYDERLPIGTIYVNQLPNWEFKFLVHVAACTAAAVALSLVLRRIHSLGSTSEKVTQEAIDDDRLSLAVTIVQMSVVGILLGIASWLALGGPCVYFSIVVPFAGRQLLAWL